MGTIQEVQQELATLQHAVDHEMDLQAFRDAGFSQEDNPNRARLQELTQKLHTLKTQEAKLRSDLASVDARRVQLEKRARAQYEAYLLENKELQQERIGIVNKLKALDRP